MQVFGGAKLICTLPSGPKGVIVIPARPRWAGPPHLMAALAADGVLAMLTTSLMPFSQERAAARSGVCCDRHRALPLDAAT
jgi:hypothetical protein